MMTPPDWLVKLEENISRWLVKVADLERPGRFYPCLKGRTKVGDEASLGFSCFALRIYYVIGWWERLENEWRKEWVNFIQFFQKSESPYEGAFVDPPILDHCESWVKRVKDILLRGKHPGLTYREAIQIAETKQAITTLAQVGAKASFPLKFFPYTSEGIRIHLRKKLNWSQPWGAGGQAAALAAFVSCEAPRFLCRVDVEELKEEMRKFFREIVDPETGGWYIGYCPPYGEFINGAMKVLNALEWLDAEIPYPDRLIDTCLSSLPQAEGCHLLNVIYVLYRCSQHTKHRCKDVTAYCKRILELISQHRQLDGAFSYFLNHNQTHYYGAQIAVPIRQSDIHGTYLLTFAIAMIGHLLEWKDFTWRFVQT